MRSASKLLAGGAWVVVAMAIVGCSSSDSGSAADSSPSEDNREAQLTAELPGQNELTKQLVSDGIVTQEEQELAIASLFECYTEYGLTPSAPEWDGLLYTWTVDTGASDPELGAKRSDSMFECERRHWDFVFSYINAIQGPTTANQTNVDALVADCVTAKGLDGAGYLAGDPAVLGTPEAATCYQEVQQDIAQGGS